MKKKYFAHISFGYRFKCWREKHGLSKLEAAVYVGCSQSYINQLEEGKASNGHIDMLLTVAAAMEVELEEFIIE